MPKVTTPSSPHFETIRVRWRKRRTYETIGVGPLLLSNACAVPRGDSRKRRSIPTLKYRAKIHRRFLSTSTSRGPMWKRRRDRSWDRGNLPIRITGHLAGITLPRLMCLHRMRKSSFSRYLARWAFEMAERKRRRHWLNL